MTVIEGAGSYVVGEETALLACVQGLRGTRLGAAPVPGGAWACTAARRSSTTPRRSRTSRSSRARAPTRTGRSVPDGTPGSKLVCFNERFARPRRLRGAVRDVDARAVRGPRRRHGRRTRDQGAPDRRPARRDPARRRGSTFPSTSSRSRLRAAWSVTAGSSRSTIRRTCATSRRHLLRFGAHESCGKCFPCRIGLRRAYDLFARRPSRSAARTSRRCSRRSRSAACARTAAGSRRRCGASSRHYPEELRLA